MKTRLFLCVVTAALIAAGFSACKSIDAPVAAEAVSSADELDTAIRAASDYLNDKVPPGSKAVFLNIQSKYPDLSEYLLSTLSENAVNDGVFSVVDRQQLDLIRAELNFQLSGEVSDESAQSIGLMLGAQSIVSGAVSKLGSLYRVQVKAIAVQSAGVQGLWSRNVPNGATIAALTQN
jgi:curli biogenesis system outer membrane secretion channel CsgG